MTKAEIFGEIASAEEEEALIKKLENDPVFFIEVFLGRDLSDKQKEFIYATKTWKHVIAIWSRQTGKSTVIASYLLHRLLYGKGCVVNGEHMDERIAIIAPIKEQINNLYEKVVTLVDKSPFISNYIIKMNTERIVLKNGNRANLMSASPGSHIRGYTATCIVIDESQDILDHKYHADIMPFGSTTDALIIEAGTPKTKNHFYRSMSAKHIKVVKQPWFECPFISKEFVMAQKEVSPDSLWRQEYMCEFVEEGVLAFPSILFEPEIKDGKETGRHNLAEYKYIKHENELTKRLVEKILEDVRNGAQFVAGLDLGKQNDNSVYTVYRVDIRPIRLEVKIKFPLETLYKRIAEVIGIFHRAFGPYEFNFDYTNEKGFLERLRENDVPAYIDKKRIRSAIAFGNKNKGEMINTTRLLLEQYQLQLPSSAEMMIQEFLNQQFELNSQEQKSYFHPSGENDDSLWSTLLALKNITTFTTDDILTFKNIWERTDEEHHGPNRKITSEVLIANQSLRQRGRGYQTAQSRRLRAGRSGKTFL